MTKGHLEDAIVALSRQRYIDLGSLLLADREGLPSVEVLPSVNRGVLIATVLLILD